jgi:hypothetical protein
MNANQNAKYLPGERPALGCAAVALRHAEESALEAENSADVMVMHRYGSIFPAEAGGIEPGSRWGGSECIRWVKHDVIESDWYAWPKRSRNLAGNG